jgi:glyoxylase-like metal-dependent hydrolase (beta-lactamase superfamily II)
LDGDPTQSYEYVLQVFLVLGEGGPMMVDVGLVDIDAMNKGAAKVLLEPITQRPDETVTAQLAHFGLTPADIRHVFITHLHFDHVDGLEAFTSAQVHIGRQEWELAIADDMHGSWGHGRIMGMGAGHC